MNSLRLSRHRQTEKKIFRHDLNIFKYNEKKNVILDPVYRLKNTIKCLNRNVTSIYDDTGICFKIPVENRPTSGT